jgi:hypothetical protein
VIFSIQPPHPPLDRATCAAPPRLCIGKYGYYMGGVCIYRLLTPTAVPAAAPAAHNIYNIIYLYYCYAAVWVRAAHKLAVRIAFTSGQEKSTYIMQHGVCISSSRDPDERTARRRWRWRCGGRGGVWSVYRHRRRCRRTDSRVYSRGFFLPSRIKTLYALQCLHITTILLYYATKHV